MGGGARHNFDVTVKVGSRKESVSADGAAAVARRRRWAGERSPGTRLGTIISEHHNSHRNYADLKRNKVIQKTVKGVSSLLLSSLL